MYQRFLLGGFKWVENTSHFSKDFIKNSNEGYFPEGDVQYPQKLHELHNNLPFFA